MQVPCGTQKETAVTTSPNTSRDMILLRRVRSWTDVGRNGIRRNVGI